MVTPGYSVEFKDYKEFGAKKIARRLVSDLEPGTTIEAKVTELSPLSNADASLFAVAEVTRPADRIKTVQVSDNAGRNLSADTPPIQWPTIRGGKTSGVLSLYVCVDRKGDNHFDKIVPPADLPYVGWTEPGEWFNITVDLTHAGTYAADFLYTSNRGGTISLDVNGKDVTGPLQIASTYDPVDPLAWRQWHHWNLASQLFKVRLNKGKNVLTVHILTGGNMNLAYFDFKQVRG